MNYTLLNKLTHLFGPSGDESEVRDFLIEYTELNMSNWKVKPEIIHGDDFQNNLILVFGKPKTAVFAHIDSIGFTVRYTNQLVPIGSPSIEPGTSLRGHDSLGPIECLLNSNSEGHVFYEFGRPIDRGTNLVWNESLIETKNFIESPYLDNRLGVFACLKLAETLENGIIVFSTWEEHNGGSVPYLVKYLYDNYQIRNTLISDITWITDGVFPGEGVVISMRDRNIPRREYLNRIIALASESGIPYQLEVEGQGSSDGREVQESPYPIDWLFIGAAEQNVHSSHEKVHKDDIESMIEMYKYLFKHLA